METFIYILLRSEICIIYFTDDGNIVSDGSSGSIHHSQHGPQPGAKYLFVLELNHHRPVFGTGGRFRLLQNGTLVIRNVGETDEGSYLCEADNGVNEPLGKVVKLKVNGKKVLTPINNRFYKYTLLKTGSDLLFVTQMDLSPFPVVFYMIVLFCENKRRKLYIKQ